MNHGWQSESTDGPTGGWSCIFWSGCNGCSGHLTTTVGCSVVPRAFKREIEKKEGARGQESKRVREQERL